MTNDWFVDAFTMGSEGGNKRIFTKTFESFEQAKDWVVRYNQAAEQSIALGFDWYLQASEPYQIVKE